MARFTPAKNLFPIALSPTALARAIQRDKSIVLAAIRAGELDCYRQGTAKRVLISDAVAWIKNTWKKVEHGN